MIRHSIETVTKPSRYELLLMPFSYLAGLGLYDGVFSRSSVFMWVNINDDFYISL